MVNEHHLVVSRAFQVFLKFDGKVPAIRVVKLFQEK